MSKLLENGKLVTLILVGCIVGGWLIHQLGPVPKIESIDGAVFFDTHPDFDFQAGFNSFEKLGVEGRKLYRQHFWTDLVFGIFVFGGVATLFWYATSKSALTRTGGVRWLVGLIVLAAGLDIAENLAIQSAINAYPVVTQDHLSSIARMVRLKFSGLILIAPILLLSVVLLVDAFFKSKLARK